MTELVSPRDLHVLVVDDDANINRLLRLCVAARGYRVSSTKDGESALAWLECTAADMILLDMSMPGLGGLDVLDRIRAAGYDTAVIMTTAFGSENVAIDALRRGADDYLRKPFEHAELAMVLDRTASRLLLNRQNVALRQQLDAKRRQLEAELARAAEVQAELLPRRAPDLPGFEIAAECVPALEVGGDFYDWQACGPGLLSVRLCDVMGKGMPAALMMATLRAVMRAVVRHSTPADAMSYVASAVDDDFTQVDRFVTLFLGQLDITTCRLSYVDAGHGHVFMRRANGDVELLPERGLPLGVLAGERYINGWIAFEPGDALVIYSDGLVDARPDLALDPRALAHHLDGATSALAIIDRCVALLAPVGTPPDDVTVVAIRRSDLC